MPPVGTAMESNVAATYHRIAAGFRYNLQQASVTSNEPVVLIVDDDARLREALLDLLASFGVRSVALGSAAEYLAHPRPEGPACLLLDVELPDISGLDLQRQIASGYHPPIIFITGHGSVPASVRAIKAGALDFWRPRF